VVEHLTCVLIDGLLGSHSGRGVFSRFDLARGNESEGDGTGPEFGVKA